LGGSKEIKGPDSSVDKTPESGSIDAMTQEASEQPDAAIALRNVEKHVTGRNMAPRRRTDFHFDEGPAGAPHMGVWWAAQNFPGDIMLEKNAIKTEPRERKKKR